MQVNPLTHFRKLAGSNHSFLPTHHSLYLALYWTWLESGSDFTFHVYRKDLMRLAKIRSVATYHKCVKDLITAGAIRYEPTYNYHEGSRFSLTATKSEP